jgi:hypothetical protein
MLTRLTRRLRLRLAATLAAAYALCVIAPPVALAFTDGKVAAHCLNENHHVMAAVPSDGGTHVHTIPAAAQPAAHEHAAHDHHAVPHDHVMPAMHDHAGATSHDRAQPVQAKADPQHEGKSTGGNCCGLFCLGGATFAMLPAIGIAPRAGVLHPALQADVAGVAPARIDRPPNSLLS